MAQKTVQPIANEKRDRAKRHVLSLLDRSPRSWEEAVDLMSEDELDSFDSHVQALAFALAEQDLRARSLLYDDPMSSCYRETQVNTGRVVLPNPTLDQQERKSK